MRLDTIDERQICQYLLGKLEQEQQRRLEERLMTQDHLFEQVQVLEDELIDEYLKNALSPQDKEDFEKHFLSAPERRSTNCGARTRADPGSRRLGNGISSNALTRLSPCIQVRHVSTPPFHPIIPSRRSWQSYSRTASSTASVPTRCSATYTRRLRMPSSTSVGMIPMLGSASFGTQAYGPLSRDRTAGFIGQLRINALGICLLPDPCEGWLNPSMRQATATERLPTAGTAVAN